VKYILLSIFLLNNILLFAQPINVTSYYGKYNTKHKSPGHPAGSLSKSKSEIWNFSKPSKKYKIAVLLPHLKDPYFLSVNHGILKQANKNNIEFKLYEAGGYNKLYKQKEQFYKAIKDGVDGIILASIHYKKFSRDIYETKRLGIPVVAVINDINAAKIEAKALVSFYQMGYKTGEYIAEKSKDKNINVAFLPGPDGSGWAPDTFDGFKQAILDSNNENINIYEPLYGDTGDRTQAILIDRAFHYFKNIDYLVGNAVMAVEATKYLKNTNNNKTKVVSTYIIPEVYNLIKSNKILAAPSDNGMLQAMIAVDMIQKILDGKKAGIDFPFRAGPVIPIINQKNVKEFEYDSLFGEKNFKAVFDNK
jgi:protein TorT